MELFEAIAKRRSVRAYKKELVSDAALAQILEAARISPTAGNRQEYKFIIVKDEAIRKALVPICNNQGFVGEAPVVIVGCSTNPSRRYSAVDVAIAMDHMTLAAAALGLGSCWIGAFSEGKVKELLGIPDGVTVWNLLPIGVPAAQSAPRPRKTVEELFPVDKWA